MEEQALKIKICEMNPHIVCSLCAGYFIDATTVTECLHTFCKSCIVKHLQSSHSCPQCGLKIHETQPIFHLRPDRTMQDIVFKLVPGLFEGEEKRKEEFHRSRGLIVLPKEGDGKIWPKVSCMLNNPKAYQYKYDEQICLCLDRYSPQKVDLHGGHYDLPILERKFIRCSIRVLVCHLKTMLNKKLTVPAGLKLEIVCEEEDLADEMSLKQIFLVCWDNRPTPMMMFYRLKSPD
ncbi:hypothetical protein ScPMuIL_001458 [Solemya velum]